MLNRIELIKALKIQEQTYNLAFWLNSAIKKGIIRPEKAMDYAASFVAAKNWIVDHYHNLPIDGRPDSLEPKDLGSFTFMFISHFNSSFDIEDKPGQRYVPHRLRNGGLTHVDNPHIQPKKIDSKDKSRARKLKIDYIKKLAIASEKQITDIIIENLIDNSELKEKIAVTTYGMQLINRMSGHDEGTANLALWREFAWDQNGSPKKKTKLDADKMLNYEILIVKKLNG